MDKNILAKTPKLFSSHQQLKGVVKQASNYSVLELEGVCLPVIGLVAIGEQTRKKLHIQAPWAVIFTNYGGALVTLL